VSLSRAEKNFRLWHDKEPDDVFEVRTRRLDEEFFSPVGWAENIVYESGKWEEGGKTFLYDHDFTSRPLVYVPDSLSDGDVIGSRIKTTSLLSIRNKNAENAFALLGTVKELTMRDSGGRIVEIDVGREAYLCSTPDRKGLLVLSDDIVLIVRGGKMSVTSRGIVK